MNLDGDPVIDEALVKHAFENLNVYGDKYLVGHSSNTGDIGIYGTIVVPFRLFEDMRGYSEEFWPCGFQDT